MKKFRHLIAATVAGALIATLAFLYEKTQAVDLRESNDVAALLATLRDIDSRWDIDVMRERSEIDPDRPAVPNRAATAEKALAGLAAVLPRAGSAALNEGLGGLRNAIMEKAGLVEKYQNESVRTKVALHVALARATELGATPAPARKPGTQQKSMGQAVAELIDAAQQYYWLGKAAGPMRLQTAVAEVEALAAGAGEAASAQAAAIGGAIQELVRHKPVEEELFVKVSSLSAGPRLDRMSFALTRELEEALQEKALYRVYLLAYAAALLLGMGYLGVRLVGAKEELEQRLAERTHELAAAMHRLHEPKA